MGTIGFAQSLCRFEWECLSNEACAQTDFTVTLDVKPTGPSDTEVAVTMTSDAETVALSGVRQDDDISVHGFGEFPTSRLLSASLSGSAIYTVHFGPDLPITYIGSCE